MLAIDRINWTNLVSFTSAGLQVADYTQIRSAVTDMFKQVYGEDIDISTASADGIYIENYCLIINNILQSFKTFYASLNVNEASGHYLEVLSALTNVYRKAATKSTASLTLTLDSSEQAAYTASSIKFVDKAGITWTANASDIQQTEFTLEPGQAQTVKVSCDEVGPISAPAGWIDKTAALDVIIEVEQPQPASVGTTEESDAKLRARRSSSVGTQANSVLEALVGELYKLNGIVDVKIYNNDSGAVATAKDGTTINNHDVYVLIRQQNNVDLSDSLVGTTIYENMTPGIHTTTGSNSFQYTQSFLGQDLQLDSLQIANWRVVNGIHTPIVINITPRQYYGGKQTGAKIADALVDFCNGLSIGEDVTVRDIYDVIEMADPLFRGRRTFDISTVAANGVVKTLGEVLVESPDVFFDYSTTSVSDDGYTITIS